MTFPSIEWIAGAGIAAAFWRQIMNSMQRLRSFFIVRTSLSGNVARAVRSYCWKNFKRSPFGDRFYKSESAFVRPLGRMQEVGFELPPIQPIIFFDGWKPIFVTGGAGDSRDNATLTSSASEGHCATVTTFRFLTDIETLVVAALKLHNSGKGVEAKNRYRVNRASGRGRFALTDYANRHEQSGSVAPAPYSGNSESPALSGNRYLIWQVEELGPENPANPMGALALPSELQEASEEFKRWKDSEEWFRAHSVPWRRGWLLHGLPGTGKTSLVRALAQEHDMPIYSFDLSSLSNEEMQSAWRNMQESAPCIALFEDLDGTFNGRENRLGEQGGGLTFDCLLNCIGGVETCDGVFTVVTTNHIECIDPAMGIPQAGTSSRPGRLDRAIEMPSLTEECFRQIAERILGDWPELIASVLKSADGKTGAQFTEACVQVALNRYWEMSPVQSNGKHLTPTA